jgi:hypothetical protein
MKKFFLPLLILVTFSCKRKFDYTMKLYFLKRKGSGKSVVEVREKGFNAPTDSLAYEHALFEYIQEGKKPDWENGTPAKFEVYNREGKQINVAHGYY